MTWSPASVAASTVERAGRRVHDGPDGASPGGAQREWREREPQPGPGEEGQFERGRTQRLQHVRRPPQSRESLVSRHYGVLSGVNVTVAIDEVGRDTESSPGPKTVKRRSPEHPLSNGGRNRPAVEQRHTALSESCAACVGHAIHASRSIARTLLP